MKRLLLLTCLLTVTATSVAFAATYIYSSAGHGTFSAEPSTLKYKPEEVGGTQKYVLKNLTWEGWGKAKAVGEGSLRSCVTGGSCFDSDADLKASKILDDGGDGYYTKLKVYFGQNYVTLRIPTPHG